MKTYEPGVIARLALFEALKTDQPTVRHCDENSRPWDCGEFSRHWPSSIAAIDRMIGGFYGVTVIASEGKVGKSTLALASAIEAAGTMDRQVKYFDAELTDHEMRDRFSRYMANRPSCSDGLSMLQVYHVARGVSPEELVTLCDEEAGPEPLLVVLDSINTLASLSGRNYLASLASFSLWAMMAHRYSGGAVSFLIVAETNKSGGIKGEQLQFWADCIVRLREPKERGWVDIDITHSRRTEAGPVGRFLRHTPSASFRQHGEHLRVVGGEWD